MISRTGAAEDDAAVRFLPPGAGHDAAVLLQTRAIRAFGDGMVSVVLVGYLVVLGLSESQIGVVIAATLLGSAALTLGVGLRGHRVGRRRLLQLVSLLMILTGLGFAAADAFWVLLIIAFVGTLNPSSGDVSVFLPTEQALLPGTAPDSERTALFARYALIGLLLAAFGALCAGVPEWIGGLVGSGAETALRWTFVGYAALGVIILLRYRSLSPAIEPRAEAPAAALGPSRGIVYRLAALFTLDAFGGGFVITALVVLWLQRRFDLSIAVSGAVFFWAGLLSAFSSLLSVRTSYVMAVVSPAERAAAASVTNVPRSLASVAPPIVAAWLLSHSAFGWPLVIGGVMKIIYDLLLLRRFRDIRPPEEQRGVTADDDHRPSGTLRELG